MKLRNMAIFGKIKGVPVMLIVDMEAFRDRRFKLRYVDINEANGWDFGDNDSSCLRIVNDENADLEKEFSGFVK
jgi:hypothetical protein